MLLYNIYRYLCLIFLMLIRYNLKEEEKNLREELEKLKLQYLEEEKKNKQLTQELNDAQNEIQNLKVSNILYILKILPIII